MAERTAQAIWRGNLKDGAGTVRLGSGSFEGPYSFPSPPMIVYMAVRGRTAECGGRVNERVAGEKPG